MYLWRHGYSTPVRWRVHSNSKKNIINLTTLWCEWWHKCHKSLFIWLLSPGIPVPDINFLKVLREFQSDWHYPIRIEMSNRSFPSLALSLFCISLIACVRIDRSGSKLRPCRCGTLIQYVCLLIQPLDTFCFDIRYISFNCCGCWMMCCKALCSYIQDIACLSRWCHPNGYRSVVFLLRFLTSTFVSP